MSFVKAYEEEPRFNLRCSSTLISLFYIFMSWRKTLVNESFIEWLGRGKKIKYVSLILKAQMSINIKLDMNICPLPALSVLSRYIGVQFFKDFLLILGHHKGGL